MKDTFSTYHPCVNFLYFGSVLLYSMYFMHPVCLAITLLSAFAWFIYLKGKKGLMYLFLMGPMFLGACLINPAFNHEGVTILTYLPTGNPLTLESITYGMAAAAMLAAVILWFACYNEIMTTDKFVYMFGRIIPALSLILSMALRFVPKFQEQIKVVSNAQKCVGRDVSNGSVRQRIRQAIRILSIMITWVLESSIETADSMRCRGYGLSGRTAFSIYEFDSRDKSAMAFIAGTGIYIFISAFRGDMYFRYFPSMKGVEFSAWSLTAFLAFFLLCNTPLIIDIWEDRKWKLLQSQT